MGHVMTSFLPALLVWAVFPGVLAAQDPVAEGTLHVWSQRSGGGVYVSPGERVGAARIRAWSWDVTSNAATPDVAFGFHNEYDCAQGTFRRLQRVRLNDGRVVERVDVAEPHRSPTLMEVESDLLPEFCAGKIGSLVTVPSLEAARSLARNPRQ